jgi:peptide deformylase
MIYPIYIIGTPVLRKKAKDIDKDYPDFKNFLENLWDTMYKTDGIGLASPQVGKAIRVFVIDGDPLKEDYPELENFKKTFINAHITEQSDDKWSFNEGCLSIPEIREDVSRSNKIRMEYYDENWEFHDEVFEGGQARIMQHEYDHIDGILFTDKISPIRRRLIKGKLNQISKGKIIPKYRHVIASKIKN